MGFKPTIFYSTRMALFLWALSWVTAVIGRYRALKYLLYGRDMIREKAATAGDAPFSLPVFGFGGRMHIVSTAEHWDDLKKAHVGHLSMHYWVKEIFQPKYTLIDEWHDNRDDIGMPVVRAIRTITSRLSRHAPTIMRVLERELRVKIQTYPTSKDYYKVALADMAKWAMVKVNTLIILGEDTATDPEFIGRGFAYTKEMSMIGEIVRIVPAFLAPIAASVIKKRNLNQRYVLDTMMRLVQKRRDATNGLTEEAFPEAKSILEAFVDQAPELSTREVVHHINIFWTTTTHSVGLVSVQFIKDIYTHTSLIPALLDEGNTAASMPPTSTTANECLLEGVLIESMRLHCFQSTAIHRKAISPFTFSDGYTIPAGQSVQFYQERAHMDEDRYGQSTVFDPRRYKASSRSVTDVGMEWPFWGVGRNACPGRFIFSYSVKLFASFLLKDYDCELLTPRKNWTWGENSIPDSRNVLLMRPKNLE